MSSTKHTKPSQKYNENQAVSYMHGFAASQPQPKLKTPLLQGFWQASKAYTELALMNVSHCHPLLQRIPFVHVSVKSQLYGLPLLLFCSHLYVLEPLPCRYDSSL